jgi:Ca2+:H+ antiporter
VRRFFTLLLRVIAPLLFVAELVEILVDTVDVVLGSGTIDEKFLGFTLFALVPNTTEFLNAISFALNGNIALRFAPCLRWG